MTFDVYSSRPVFFCNGLVRSDWRRRDAVTVITEESGKCLVLDASVNDTLSQSYRIRVAEDAVAATEVSAERKSAKNTTILQAYCFMPLVLEILGPTNQEGLAFVSSLGHCLAQITRDNRQNYISPLALINDHPTLQRIAFHSTFGGQHDINED